MKKMIPFFIGSFALGVIVVFLFGGLIFSRELYDSLDKDIERTSHQIKEIEKENEEYVGGLIKVLVFLRLQILKNTKAMLEQRRHSSKYGVKVKYTYKGEVYKPELVDSSLLQSIELDIKKQKNESKKAEIEDAKYSGGLIKAMIGSQIATIQNTLAMLEQKELSVKYGIPLFAFSEESREKAVTRSLPLTKTEKGGGRTPPAPVKKGKMKIVDWTNRVSASGNYIYVEGILKNTGKAVARGVQVKVKSLDTNGKLISLDDGFADPYNVRPGQETTFQVMVNYDTRIEKFSLSVLWK